MDGFIPLSEPNLNGNELRYVTDAIEEEWVSTGGAYINKFEENISEYLKIEGAVACQSGTSAIHLSLLECGVKPNDEVIVPTLTFIAAVNPVTYCGAYPVFMDCDDSLTIDTLKLKEFFKNECEFDGNLLFNKKSKKAIKAIIVVHVFGNLANMEEIMKMAKYYNLKVIEDATEALGSYYKEGIYKGRFAGTIGDLGCYSFNGNKIITTGGGGMIVSKDNDKLNHIKYISTQSKDDAVFYIHNEIGYNYRMTNLQAALGVAQLESLEKFIDIKKENYNEYKKIFKNVDEIEVLEFAENTRPNYWFYSIVLKNKDVNIKSIIEKLLKRDIQTRPIWGLIHEQKPYINSQNYNIEKAYHYQRNVLNIPCSTNLSKDKVIKVANEITNLIKD